MEVRGVFSGMNISETGLRAEKRRMEAIANNLANINTTRTPEGGPYKKQEVVLKAKDELKGVEIAGVAQDKSVRMVYDPQHPDANKDGYVKYPDIDLPKEWAKIVTASRAYEANIAAFNLQKQSMMKSLDLLK